MSLIGGFVEFIHPSKSGIFFGEVVLEDHKNCTIEYFMDPDSGNFEIFEVTVRKD